MSSPIPGSGPDIVESPPPAQQVALAPPAAPSSAAAAVASAPSDSNSNPPHLSLRWEDYPQSLVNTFRNLKEEEDFVDVTLACNSQQFTAHKVVLSACSPYFRQLLKVRKTKDAGTK